MNRDAKVGLSLAILLMGIAAALCFPREQPRELPALHDPGSLDQRIAEQPLAPYVPRDTDAPTAALGPATDHPDPALLDVPNEDPFTPSASLLDRLFPPARGRDGSPPESSHDQPSGAAGSERHGRAAEDRPSSRSGFDPAAEEGQRRIAAAPPSSPHPANRPGRVEILPPPPETNAARTFGAAPPSAHETAAVARPTTDTPPAYRSPQPYTRRTASARGSDRSAGGNPVAGLTPLQPSSTRSADTAAADRTSALNLWPPFGAPRTDPRRAVETLPAPVTAEPPPAHNTQWRVLTDDSPERNANADRPRNEIGTEERPANGAPAAEATPRRAPGGAPPAQRPAVERLPPPQPAGPLAARPHLAAKPPAQRLTEEAPPSARSGSGQRDAARETSTAEAFRIHVVQRGETLSEIALRYLGSVTRYQEIFEANRDVLSDPDSIREGMTLRIPIGRTASEPHRIPVHRLRSARGAR